MASVRESWDRRAVTDGIHFEGFQNKHNEILRLQIWARDKPTRSTPRMQH